VIARLTAILVAAGLAAAFPAFAGPYAVRLLQEILIWGVFAMSLDLLMGYAGMVSFGHSAFFGLGAYAAALGLMRSRGVIAALVLPAITTAVAAGVIGFLSIRVSGVYFIMLTLAFSQMFWAYAFQAAWLGSSDGLAGLPRPVLLGVDLARPLTFHLYVVGFVLLAGVVLWRIARSPFGHVLGGIRDNEMRMAAVGYAVERYKLATFVIGGTIAGIAGAVYTHQNGYVAPETFFWTTSGEVLLMVIIGGPGTLVGPFLGSAVFLLLQNFVSTYTERWMLVLGVAFVGFVLFAPAGLLGLLRGRVGLRA